MNIDGDTKALLNRWENIKDGDGLTKAVKVEVAVRAIGLVAFSLAGIALFEGVYPSSCGDRVRHIRSDNRRGECVEEPRNVANIQSLY